MNRDIPQHIAFIVDGNRRWAKERGLPVWEGHMQGMETMERVLDWCDKAGVKYVTTYLFSTENWGRGEQELNYLFGDIFTKAFKEKFPRLIEQNIRFNIFGEIDRFPESMRRGLINLVEKTRANTGLVWNACLNYGGRAELVRAVQQIIKSQMPSEQITKQTIADNLYSAGIPDPDLIIRTSGEQRLSGFLLWQGSYAELYFPEVYFPAFTKADLEQALQWYADRDRRYGK
ncbi:di-trans,poly-cis-decaprenylcistransferase [candidate division Kazan bacterium RIFCSPHIGHO2_01_FULL_44_14]|uniref:Isoprenyl transferase n=1 Tax=candidate division Kazan bacterium RIFCSPLOWO2_01_FULL_45_19 TaxID=1798538 RepID=A0A1F4NQW5_UNCK3|nr:hypothetical protein [uncultured bacterium]OGB73811.1 MAG: di-trans,poly-cis-decaprenylcistransferase [candidate division Kazan bacterium RIFCSPLOWO2_01_FULL_45_19]OGB78056.1 MAG: di-trans,poly-cis-decaprenylcistransferase [candidate division Kazan bacterium RIFCSPHIGHO2_01_FULL_44_14]